MIPLRPCAVALTLALVSALGWPTNANAASKVVLESSRDGFRLTYNGEPYVIRGVGGSKRLAQLAALGGNSIRTWGADNLGPLLDEAHRHGLTVCVGLWLGHQRHGFDYQDEASVVKQREACLAAVRRYKDHPAVLMWGIGNEMEGEGKNPAVWHAVEQIARECKQIDPNHPTMTVVAEPCEGKAQSIERFCPSIDIIGVNSYGAIVDLAERYRAAGVSKPYLVTEFGPRGPWEAPKTAWGSPVEATSTEKGEHYAESYRRAVAEQAGLCVGSYAFYWENKQETTATWFGMVLPDGSRLAAADVMTEAWTGRPPENRCPRIERMEVDPTSGLQPGDVVNARLVTTDPEGDALSYEWVLRSDAGTIGVGGDVQEDEASIADGVAASGAEARVTLPDDGGGYRLFAYVRDKAGGAAVANVPLHIDAPIKPMASPRASLPHVVYADNAPPTPYAPSGYMGNSSAVRMTLDSTDAPHSGATCLRVDYDAKGDWGGVLWQSPPNDWDGAQPGGLNLTGATELEFWARGAEGGERVDFVLGVIDGDQPYGDTAKAELKGARLTTEWQKLRIPLDGRDLSRIKTGFGWSLAGQGRPVTFYLDDIRYVGP